MLALIVLTPASGNEAIGVVSRFAQALARVTGMEYGRVFPAFEFAANVLLFVRLGVLVPMAWGKFNTLVTWGHGLGLAVSVYIEMAQLGIPGRVADPRDLISNTLGLIAGLGFLIAVRKLRLLRSSMG